MRHCLLLACLAGLVPAAAPAADARPSLQALASVPRQDIAPARVQALVAGVPSKDRPYRFAVAVDVPLPPAAGLWTVEGGRAVWRARIRSAGALSLSASFPEARLPAGTELRTYDPAAEQVHGPYHGVRSVRVPVWTPLVGGDELVVEARMPHERAADFSLGTAKAYHGFRDWKSHQNQAHSGEAGWCNVDVTCDEAATWLPDAGSVAKITIGNVFACSGQLVNNVRQDERRLFLTAAHCGVGTEEAPGESVVFYFNYVGQCGNNRTDPQPPQTFQGVVVLAEDPISDVALLEIVDESALPAGAYFAGWDVTGAVTASGASIHHPMGDEKKISFFGTPPTADSVAIQGRACNIDAYEVRWSRGTTEVGSSGGGLWNSDRRLIGVLSGGSADCAQPGAPDFYGRLDRGWTAHASASGQLKAHLDPDGTCIATVPGLAAGAMPAAHPPGVARLCAAAAAACSAGTSRGLAVPGMGGGGSAGTLAAGALLFLLLRRRRG